MLSSIDDILALHESSGNVNDAYKKIHIDDKIFLLNTYTLRVKRGNLTKDEANNWNRAIISEIKKNRNLYKEIGEFNSLFELFSRLKIKTGHISKCERPDFIYKADDGKTSGIEVTKIYVGNDWAVEKMTEEIQSYRLRKEEVEGYIEYKKYYNKIKTYNVRGGIVIAPLSESVSIEEYINEIKNKIFEKIRKLFEEYNKCDENVVFAEIVSPVYFVEEEQFERLNSEISFFIQHMEEVFDEKEYKLILKTSNNWVKFDFKNGIYSKF